jgi:hypothetical protein
MGQFCPVRKLNRSATGTGSWLLSEERPDVGLRDHLPLAGEIDRLLNHW